ncbi:hypothetical protein Tco_0432744 [Tanacetum coccineum]
MKDLRVLPSNTIPNPREDIKVITTRSGITLAEPLIPSPNSFSSSKEVERDPETTMDQIPEQNPHHPPIPYPLRLNKDKLQDKSDIQIHKFLQMFKKLHFNISFAETLAQMPKYAKMLKDLLTNKEKLLELANTPLNENCSAVPLKKLPEKLEECLALADLGASITLMPLSVWKKLMLPELMPTRMTLELANQLVAYLGYSRGCLCAGGGCPTPSFDLVVASLSPSFTPFEDSDFLFEKTDAFLALDDSIQPKIYNVIYDSERDSIFLEKLLYDDPTKDLPPKELKNDETKTTKSSIEEPPELELKDLPPHLEYAFFEGTSKLPVIIANDLKREEKDQLIKVLKSHKRAIAWKIFDIKGIDPNFCTHKILMEDDFKPAVQHQRRVNLKIHEVIKLLDVGLIYPILDSPWVSPMHVVPKKGGITVVTNDNNELIPSRLVTRWRVFHKDLVSSNSSGVGGSGMLMEEEEIVKLMEEEEEMADL